MFSYDAHHKNNSPHEKQAGDISFGDEWHTYSIYFFVSHYHIVDYSFLLSMGWIFLVKRVIGYRLAVITY